MAPPKISKSSDRPAAGSADPRFASISSDPRFRLPSTKHARVGVDKRFARMFKDDDFNRKPKVDKYGRRVEKSGDNEKLRRLYQAEEDEDEDEDEEDEEVEEVKVKKGAKPKKRQMEIASASEDEESDEVDEDEAVQAELQRVGSSRDLAREGFSSSEEDSSDDEDVEDEDLEAELPEESEANAVPMGDISRRVAIVNLDWDNIRAMDLMAVAQSFVPSDGTIEQVSVYPSEFGKERMEKEELEGPPKEIFAKSKKDVDEDEEEDSEEEEERIRKELQKGDTGEEFDSAKLRRYQLDRLKYFYAVVTCTSASTAKALYDAMDGREYLSTSNFFDLRFVPDEVSFDEDRPRDECRKIPTGYKPNEFVTDALTHSKVKLTWDNDDTTRKEVQKRAFSRAEIDENDLQAYIGSESSEDEEEQDDAVISGSKADKEAQRQKMREALGLSSKPVKATKAANGPVGDMQITFTSGLSNAGKKAGNVFENGPSRDESTKEMYVRKEKERKERRRAKAKAAREGGVVEDEHSGAEHSDVAEEQTHAADEDDPFNDPFFNDAPAAQKAEKAQRKADRLKKREERQQEEKANAAKRAELELLMVDDKEDNMKHFNMTEIQKAEKLKRKGKKGKKAANATADDAAVEDGFKIETQDPRFASLFESHEYAIDPTNPRYKGTEGMKALLNEGRKRRKNRPEQGGDAVEEEERASKKAKKADDAEPDLAKLVAKVKGRSKKA